MADKESEIKALKKGASEFVQSCSRAFVVDVFKSSIDNARYTLEQLDRFETDDEDVASGWCFELSLMKEKLEKHIRYCEEAIKELDSDFMGKVYDIDKFRIGGMTEKGERK